MSDWDHELWVFRKQNEVVILTDNLNTWLVLYKLGIIYQVCLAEILHWKANGMFLLKVGKKLFCLNIYIVIWPPQCYLQELLILIKYMRSCCLLWHPLIELLMGEAGWLRMWNQWFRLCPCNSLEGLGGCVRRWLATVFLSKPCFAVC